LEGQWLKEKLLVNGYQLLVSRKKQFCGIDESSRILKVDRPLRRAMLINIELGELDPPAAVIDRRYRTFALKLARLPASLAATRAALPSMSQIPFAPFFVVRKAVIRYWLIEHCGQEARLYIPR
jgi:hypothetical protein